MAVTPGPNRGRYVVDLLERIVATGVEGGIGVLIVQSADWPLWVSAPIAAAAALVKCWAAKLLGNPDSASLAPRV